MAINTTFVSGAVLTAAQANNLPWGVAGSQTLTTAFATVNPNQTLQDTGQTVTITAVMNRIYKVTWTNQPYDFGGNNTIIFALLVGGVEQQRISLNRELFDNVNHSTFSNFAFYTAVASGSLIFKMQMAAVNANTVVNDFGSSTFKRTMVVEDMGLA